MQLTVSPPPNAIRAPVTFRRKKKKPDMGFRFRAGLFFPWLNATHQKEETGRHRGFRHTGDTSKRLLENGEGRGGRREKGKREEKVPFPSLFGAKHFFFSLQGRTRKRRMLRIQPPSSSKGIFHSEGRHKIGERKGGGKKV